MICKVSHVTITVLSFAFDMSVTVLYKESILLALSPRNVTHYNDNLKVHYHKNTEDSDLPLGQTQDCISHLT